MSPDLKPSRPTAQTENTSEIKDKTSRFFVLTRYYRGEMDKDTLEELVQKLSPITSEGFMRNGVTEDLKEDVKHHLRCADRIIVASINGQIAAYIVATIIKFDQGNLYHLEGIIVGELFQGTGLAEKMLVTDFHEVKPDYLGFHTQNGKMLSLGKKLAHINDADSVRFGTILYPHNQQGIRDIDRYNGQSLYGDANRFSDYAVKEIDWQHGDAIVCIGPIKGEFLK